MNVLVTGGTGFVGLNLVEHCQDRGDHVKVLTRQSSPTDRLPEGVSIITGDINDTDTLESGMDGIDTVIHLAAVMAGPPEKIRSVNVEGTQNLLDAAAANGVSNVVFASTIMSHPEISISPRNEYERSKVEAEQHLIRESWPFDFSIVYPTYVVGPNDFRLVRFHHFWRVYSTPLLAPPLYTYNKYNIVHVDDVVRTLRGCPNDEQRTRYIVKGDDLRERELYRSIKEVSDRRCLILPVPNFACRYLLAPLADKLHARNVFPFEGDRLLAATNFGVVSDKVGHDPLVEPIPAKKAIRDAYTWYKHVGLI